MGDPPAIPASAARRLSGIQHRACQLALAALHRAGIERPDAIVASTALGCLADTELFLAELHDAGDALLSPLPFMRSTHNTMAGQLALMLGCNGPNITHAQGFEGFHAALVETMLLIQEHPEWNVLVLAIDERTDVLERVTQAIGSGVRVGEGGEAFLISGAALPGLARMEWADGRNGEILLPDTAKALHGSVLAVQLGNALIDGVRAPIRLSNGRDRATELLLSSC